MNIPGVYPGEYPPLLAVWTEGGHIHSRWTAPAVTLSATFCLRVRASLPAGPDAFCGGALIPRMSNNDDEFQWDYSNPTC